MVDLIGSFGEMVSTQSIAFNQHNFAVIGQKKTIDIISQPIIFQTGIDDGLVTIEQMNRLGDDSLLPSSKNFLANVELPKELFLELRKKEGVKKMILVGVGYRNSKLFSRTNRTGLSLFSLSNYQIKFTNFLLFKIMFFLDFQLLRLIARSFLQKFDIIKFQT